MTERYKPIDSAEFVLHTTASAVATPVAGNFAQKLEFEAWLRANVRMLPVTLELPHELHRWMGKIASYWAMAEWIQSGTLARILDIDRKAARVMFGDRIGNCVSKIKQNMEMQDIPVPTNFDVLSASLSECERRRNLLCHGVWLVDPDTEELCVQNPAGEWIQPKMDKVSKRKYPEAMYPTPTWMEETLTMMQKAIRGVQEIDSYLDAHKPPFPRRSA